MITQVNDIDVRVEDISRFIIRRINQSAISGTPNNPIDKLGFSGITFDAKLYTLTEADFDTLMAEMYEDDVELHVRVGWFYYAIVTKLEGKFEESDVNYFPLSATFKTEEPFAYSVESYDISAIITTNQQTFGGSTIQTFGNVNAVPNITITGGTDDATILTQSTTW